MHEIGIVQGLIDQAARAAEGRPIRQIHVALGDLSDVTPEALEFYFDQLRAGTPAAEASLAIRHEPSRARCDDCGSEFAAAEVSGGCPACGSARLQVVAGDRLILEAIDVE
jgi:hydrogenase nickel incorporation protein HypA/HybF